jgi:hypothetical protein
VSAIFPRGSLGAVGFTPFLLGVVLVLGLGYDPRGLVVLPWA